MKMNKLAAGALALALGLGAVAPAVAAEKEYTGAQLFLEKYEAKLKEANAKRLAAIDAEAKIKVAEERLEAAKARVAEKEAAYKALFPKHVLVQKPNTKGEKIEDFYTVGELDKLVGTQAQEALDKALGSRVVSFDVTVENYLDAKKYDKDREKMAKAVYAQIGKDLTDAQAAAVERYLNAVIDLSLIHI